jgi:hypothetical protein
VATPDLRHVRRGAGRCANEAVQRTRSRHAGMVDVAGAMELRRRVLLKRYDPRCVSAAQGASGEHLTERWKSI